MQPASGVLRAQRAPDIEIAAHFPMSFPVTEYAPNLAQNLEGWFATSQRDLPWREIANARDGYRVLVSEVMLQQTTVAAVVPFYLRFLARFPDASSLARAEMDEVLPLWAGLGYYSRCRNLHAAAREIMQKHQGIFPQNFEEVLALPGVGRYTAGAVCSIAFNQKTPIVDANVARVLARVLCLEGDVKSPKVQAQLWNGATELVNASTQPSNFNPSVMELGALICVPKTPRCESCPISEFCGAFQTARQSEFPQFAPKKAHQQMHDVCVLFADTNGVLLRQRTEESSAKNWWKGMWELPRTSIQEGESPRSAIARLLNELNIQAEIGAHIKTLKHGVTTHAITLDCHQISDAEFEDSAAQIFEWDETRKLAIPSTMRQLLDWYYSHRVVNEQLALL